MIPYDACRDAGAFSAITIDGSKSVGNAGSSLTYNWQPASLLVAAQGAISLNTPVVTFTPSARGNTQFQLQVNNGPCPLSTPATVTVSAVCPAITALLQEPGSSAGASTRYNRQVTWDGTRFPTACLDGTATTYLTLTNQPAKFAILKYTWQMLTAPSGSRFEASADPVTRTIPSAMNMTYGILGYLDAVLANSTADVQWKQRLWENVTTVRTITVSTFLNNHHEVRGLPWAHVIT